MSTGEAWTIGILGIFAVWMWWPRKPKIRPAAPPGPAPAMGATRQWSGVAAALPIKQLTRQQADCLHDAIGTALTRTPDGSLTLDGQPIWLYNGRTVSSLLKHGMLVEEQGRVSITDLGLQAWETLPTRN